MNINTILFYRINSILTIHYFNIFFIFFSEYLIYIFIILTILIFFVKNRVSTKQSNQSIIILAFLSAIFGVITNIIINGFYLEKAPYNILPDINRVISLPYFNILFSNSLVILTAITGIIYVYNKKLSYSYIAGLILIGFSKIAIGQYFPIYIAQSYIIGIIAAILTYKFRNLFYLIFEYIKVLISNK